MSTDEPCNTGDEIGGRRTEWLLHRPSLKPVAGQIAVLRIPRTHPRRSRRWPMRSARV